MVRVDPSPLKMMEVDSKSPIMIVSEAPLGMTRVGVVTVVLLVHTLLMQ